jgi:hypothetical protein
MVISDIGVSYYQSPVHVLLTLSVAHIALVGRAMFWLNKPIHNFSRNAPIVSAKNQPVLKAIAQRAGGISLVQPPMRSHEYFFLKSERSLSPKKGISRFLG